MKFSYNFLTSSSSLLLLLVGVVSADKDTNYYPGWTNPNVEKYKMYWEDSVNVLQDIDSFDSLYIKYHSCVWSMFGNGADNHDDDYGCGGDGGEEYWYLGRTQCFRANMAYSLYGILKGDTAPNTVCGKATYINSFFTTGGIDSIVYSFDIEDEDATNYCSYEYVGNGENNNNNNNQDDHDHQQMPYADYVSTTTGCSADGKFITDTFQGAYCDGLHSLGEGTELESFNNEVEAMDCLQIYSSNGDDRKKNRRKLENYYGTLLSMSEACSIREFPDDCPDPHGLLKIYTMNLEAISGSNNEVGFSEFESPMPKYRIELSSIFTAIGAIFFLLACRIKRMESKKPKNHEDATSINKSPSYTLPVIEQVTRVASTVSQSAVSVASSVQQKIQDYAEEDVDDEPPSPGSKEVVLFPKDPKPVSGEELSPVAAAAAANNEVGPPTSGEEMPPAAAVNVEDPLPPPSAAAATNVEDPLPPPAAAAVAADVMPPPKAKKRPFLAKISQRIFRSKKKTSQPNY